MNKELEEAIDNLLMLKYFVNEEKEENYKEYTNAIETVLNYIDNSISKEDIKEKLEEIKYRLNETMITEKDMQYNLGKCAALQELLEGK